MKSDRPDGSESVIAFSERLAECDRIHHAIINEST